MQHTRPLAKGAALTVGAMALVTGPLASGTWAADRAPEKATSVEHTDRDGVDNNVVDAGDNRHPSGKDRSVERGGSGDQGSAAHEPDDDDHGPERDYRGLDQPDGPGGMQVEDQDGNNGCGNDDDFEDDNEGLCGKPEDRPTTPAAGAEVDDDDDVQVSGIEGHVLSSDLSRAPLALAAAATPATPLALTGEVLSNGLTAEVLSNGLTAPAAAPAAEVQAAAATSAPAGELPFTGSNGPATAIAGAFAVAGGWLLTRLGRNRRHATA